MNEEDRQLIILLRDNRWRNYIYVEIIADVICNHECNIITKDNSLSIKVHCLIRNWVVGLSQNYWCEIFSFYLQTFLFFVNIIIFCERLHDNQYDKLSQVKSLPRHTLFAIDLFD